MIDLFLFLLYFKGYLGVHRESTSGQCDADINFVTPYSHYTENLKPDALRNSR